MTLPSYDGLILPPWDEETVEALTDYQCLGMGRPYTCPRDHRDPDTGRVDRDDVILDPTEDGWICPHEGCGYTQRWAHAMSANTLYLRRLRRDRERMLGWAG